MALTIDQLNKIIALKVKNFSPSKVYVVAVRGSDGHDDLGVFDDRSYIVYDHTLKGIWKMNTNPSSQAPGRATLKPDVYHYRAGDHKGRAAFVQAGPVTIHRFGGTDESGWFGINLHDAKTNSGGTSSLGCQTWTMEDFWSNNLGFADVMYRILKVTKSQAIGHKDGIGPEFDYILITGDEANKLVAQ